FMVDRGEGCKHLWAAILVAERKNLLRGLLREPIKEVVFEAAEDWDDYESDFDDADDSTDDFDAPPISEWTVSQLPDKRSETRPAKAKKDSPDDWALVFG